MVVTVIECKNMVIQTNPGGGDDEMRNGDADVDEDDADVDNTILITIILKIMMQLFQTYTGSILVAVNPYQVSPHIITNSRIVFCSIVMIIIYVEITS